MPTKDQVGSKVGGSGGIVSFRFVSSRFLRGGWRLRWNNVNCWRDSGGGREGGVDVSALTPVQISLELRLKCRKPLGLNSTIGAENRQRLISTRKAQFKFYCQDNLKCPLPVQLRPAERENALTTDYCVCYCVEGRRAVLLVFPKPPSDVQPY